MAVPSSVLFPTPLRPMTLMHSPGATVRLRSSSTTVSPYPAVTARSSRAPGAAIALPAPLAAEIDGAHLGVGRDLPGRSAGEDGSAHHHRDLPGKAEDEIHVVVDDEDADGLRKPIEGVEDDVALGAGHAGRGLVEQQDLRPQAEGDGQLHQALATVGQLGDAVTRVAGQP